MATPALAIVPSPTEHPTLFRELLRVSADDSDRMVSTDQQHDRADRQARQIGATLLAPYIETDEDGRAVSISASRYARKARQDFADLLADLEAGTFGAHGLWVWDISRGSRKAWEWGQLIEVMLAAGVPWLRVTVDRTTYDMRIGGHRKLVRDRASDAEWSSDEKSEAVGRAMEDEALDGKPHGRAGYGFRRDKTNRADPVPDGWYLLSSDKTVMVRQVEEPEEADAVRLIFSSLLANESMRAVSQALGGLGPQPAMGVALAEAAVRYAGHPAAGTTWTPSRVRDIALNPIYAGKRLRISQETRRAQNITRGHPAEFDPADLIDGCWPALVSLDTFLTVAAKIRANRRTAPTMSRAPAHLLSMLAVCGTCGGPLAVRYTHGSGVARYTCHRSGHVTTDRDPLDALVTSAILDRLAADDLHPRTLPEVGVSRELQQARDSLAKLRTRAGEIRDAMADPDADDLADLRAAKRALAGRIEAAEKLVRDLQAPSGLVALGLTPGQDIAERWDLATLRARRAAVSALLERIAVHPVGRGYAGMVDGRTEITWR